ncbi:MAG: diacylglycerol kinase family protein [Planctomycetes bacterium]|nr:diacylglycerol kinase family protein [Planctomycetota bacterium]
MANHSPTSSDHESELVRTKQTWGERFAVACRGMKIAVRDEVSLRVHLSMATVALLASAALGISRLEWCLIILCIVVAISAELFNTAIERLAKAITREENPDIRDALDTAAGAILVIAIGAIVLAAILLGWNAWNLL